jgi:hypothetical protein
MVQSSKRKSVMKLYRNVSEIRRKESLGRRLSLSGLGILFIGLLASFVPSWFPPDAVVTSPPARFLQQYWTWISFAALPLGFVFASFGSYFINRFARRRWPGMKTIARPDEVLERNMKGFDDKYAYFAWSLPASHVLVGPSGVMVMALRSDRGKVTVQGDRWREPFSIGRFFTVFAREGVGNPSLELEDQIRKLRVLIDQTPVPKGENAAVVPIEPVAVFLNPEMQITLENPSMAVLRADQLKDYVRKRTKEVKVSPALMRAVTEHLAANSQHQGTTTAALATT